LVLTKRDLKKMLKLDEGIQNEMFTIAFERRDYHMRKMCKSICLNSDHFSLLKETTRSNITNKNT